MENQRLTEQEIVRRNKMQDLIDKGIDPFGSRYDRTATTKSIKEAYLDKTREELVKAGIEIDIEPNKGQSETWQMWIHDPDGNKFEIMQYTDKSLQHHGNIEEDQKKYGK